MTQTHVILIATVFAIGISRLPAQEVSHASRPQSVQSHDAAGKKALPVLKAKQKAGIRMICLTCCLPHLQCKIHKFGMDGWEQFGVT